MTSFLFLAFIEDTSLGINLYEHAVTDAGGPVACAIGDWKLRAKINVGPMLSSFVIRCEVDDDVLNNQVLRGSGQRLRQKQRSRVDKAMGTDAEREEKLSKEAESRADSTKVSISLSFEGKMRNLQMCRSATQEPKKRVTLCGAPLFGTITKENLYSWIFYHQLLGVEHFHLYPVDEHLAEMLAPLEEKGVVTVERWKPLSKSAQCANCREACGFERPGPLPYYTQVLAANHCLFHEQSRSEWVLFIDIDEALYFPGESIKNIGDLLGKLAHSSPEALSALFTDHDGKEAHIHAENTSALSFSNMLFSMLVIINVLDHSHRMPRSVLK